MTVYSFIDVQATIVGPGGVVDLGMGAGTAEEGISYEMAEDKGSMVLGSSGDWMQSLHAGHSGSVTVRLLKTSPTNSLLSLMYDTQRIASALWGNNVIVIRDISRGDVITAVGVAFRRTPSNTFGKEGNILEWGFIAGKIEPIFGAGTVPFTQAA